MTSTNELTLHLIASGLLELNNRVEKGSGLTVPYPAKLQRGLERFALERLRKAKPFPENVVELLAWCKRPLVEWELVDEYENRWGPKDCLLDNDFITALCEDWSRAGGDVEASLTEEHIMKRVFDTCRAAAKPETYIALRKLWIDHPILTAFEFQQQRFDPILAPVAEILDEAYAPVSEIQFTEDRLTSCLHCGNVRLPTTHGKLICESERCRALPLRPSKRFFPIAERPVWLVRALRRFVCAPGLSEVRLAQKLTALGLAVELWPDYDAYDLRVTFPDGLVWAIDVKDWADPILLAKSVKPFRSYPVWDEAFFVFPDDRKLGRPEYLKLFTRHVQGLSDRVKVKFTNEIVKMAKRRMRSNSDAQPK